MFVLLALDRKKLKTELEQPLFCFNTVSFNAQPGNLLLFCFTATAYLLAAAICTDWCCLCVGGTRSARSRRSASLMRVDGLGGSGFASALFPSGNGFPSSRECVWSHGNSTPLRCLRVSACVCVPIISGSREHNRIISVPVHSGGFDCRVMTTQ